jgi:hypothetical protein
VIWINRFNREFQPWRLLVGDPNHLRSPPAVDHGFKSSVGTEVKAQSNISRPTRSVAAPLPPQKSSRVSMMVAQVKSQNSISRPARSVAAPLPPGVSLFYEKKLRATLQRTPKLDVPTKPGTTLQEQLADGRDFKHSVPDLVEEKVPEGTEQPAPSYKDLKAIIDEMTSRLPVGDPGVAAVDGELSQDEVEDQELQKLLRHLE